MMLTTMMMLMIVMITLCSVKVYELMALYNIIGTKKQKSVYWTNGMHIIYIYNAQTYTTTTQTHTRVIYY